MIGVIRQWLPVKAEPWMDEAECKGMGPDLFFLDKTESIEEAKATCAGCPVRDQCLDYALDRREVTGIWGGMSEKERRKERKARGMVGRRIPAHGSRSRYQAGCRCCDCAQANRLYRRDWNQRQGEAS